ncbi:MAG: hypothetical protein QM773_05905 [Hyphomonadaceae bacterium]
MQTEITATSSQVEPLALAPPKDPIEFCPAAACAAAIVRLEGFLAHVARLHEEAQLARSPDLMTQLEAIQDELMLAADEARDRLAKVEAVSAAGAIAQLLAAIRDIRIRDDAERERAKDLEAKAIRFLANASLYDTQFSNMLSQTRLGRRLHVKQRDVIQRM